MPSTPLFAEACRLRRKIAGAKGYGLLYGSHADERQTTASDVDLVLVCSEPPPIEDVDDIVDEVRRMHHTRGLSIDEEVDHRNKVWASFGDVRAAVALRGFPTDHLGWPVATPVIVEPAYLNSERFRLRLLLNALTSRHVFLGGDAACYEADRRQGLRALALLALTVLRQPEFDLSEAVLSVVEHENGAREKDYLGYRSGPYLRSALHQALAGLAHEGVIRELDGDTYGCSPQSVAGALRALAEPPEQGPTRNNPENGRRSTEGQV